MRIIQIGIGFLVPLVLAVVVASSIGGQETPKKSDKAPTAAQRKIAAISKGHSYQKHVVDEELFPEIKSQADFACAYLTFEVVPQLTFVIAGE